MNVAIGPFAIAATLLMIGGAAKAIRPGDTANAFRILGVPAPVALVRVGGLLEVGIGAWALLTADRGAAVLVALSYVAFFAFVAVAMVRDAPIASCGCFGRLDTPPSRIHLVVNAVAVAVGVAVALDPGDGLRRVVEDQPMSGVAYLVLVLLGAVCALLALSVLPRALGSMAEDDE